MKHILSGSLLVLSCALGVEGRTIYGVKTAPGVPASAPSYLFACREDGTGWQTVGLMTAGGGLIEVDGLAMDSADLLYGFELTSEGSRLLAVNPATGASARIGVLLPGREIRGAAFDERDVLRAVDVARGELVTVNVATGGVAASRVLTLGGSPLNVEPACDVAFEVDGRAWLSNGDDLFALDATTGTLTFASLVSGRRLAGVCRSIHAIGVDHLFFAHAGMQVDAGWLRSEHGWEMRMLYHNLTPVISTGLSDLAGRVLPDPERCAGDADGDEAVTFADLNLILATWGMAVEAGTMGDVTGDGLVNFADINLTLDAWGGGCEERGAAAVTRGSAPGSFPGSASAPP